MGQPGLAMTISNTVKMRPCVPEQSGLTAPGFTAYPAPACAWAHPRTRLSLSSSASAALFSLPSPSLTKRVEKCGLKAATRKAKNSNARSHEGIDLPRWN